MSTLRKIYLEGAGLGSALVPPPLLVLRGGAWYINRTDRIIVFRWWLAELQPAVCMSS